MMEVQNSLALGQVQQFLPLSRLNGAIKVFPASLTYGIWFRRCVRKTGRRYTPNRLGSLFRGWTFPVNHRVSSESGRTDDCLVQTRTVSEAFLIWWVIPQSLPGPDVLTIFQCSIGGCENPPL